MDEPLEKLHSLIDGELVPTIGRDVSDEIERVLVAASRTHEGGEWFNIGHEARCRILQEVVTQLTPDVEESIAQADAAQTGVVIQLTRMINGSLKDQFSERNMASAMRRMEPRRLTAANGAFTQVRVPFGPVLILAPWNVPSGTIVAKVFAALAAGCPLIVKPSEWAPKGLEIFLRAVNRVGLPQGALQWVHGGPDVGDALVRDPRIAAISFTGSGEAGRKVASACSARFAPLLAECGGSNVAIALKDADLEIASGAIITGMTLLNGQWCAGITRIFVHTSIAEQLLEKVKRGLQGMKIGSPFEDSTEIGPLAHQGHVEHIQRCCDELIRRGGNAFKSHDTLPQGNFFSPTIITGVGGPPPDEIFGPVAVWYVYEDGAEADAIRMANSRPLLQCYLLSQDTENATSLGLKLRCGSVMINGCSPGFEGVADENGEPMEPEMSFFGGAGVGVEEGFLGAIDFMTGRKNVGVEG